MYDYSDFDEAFVRTRVAQFSNQIARRLDVSLTEDEFRPLRLMNGLYLQLHAYMPVSYTHLAATRMASPWLGLFCGFGDVCHWRYGHLAGDVDRCG